MYIVMETIDLADEFDLKRIAEAWENLSTEHSVDLGSTLLFADRFGIELPLWNERRLKLFIVGCYPLIRFPMKAVPTDPEEVYRALLRQARGNGKGAKAVTRNHEAILREWENFISLFLAPSRDGSLDLIDY
jgi:hypothetical protein